MSYIEGIPDWLFWVAVVFLVVIFSLIKIRGRAIIIWVTEALTAVAEQIVDAARRIGVKIILSALIVVLVIGIAFGADNPDITPLADRPEVFPFNLGMFVLDAMWSGFQEIILLIVGLFTGDGSQ